VTDLCLILSKSWTETASEPSERSLGRFCQISLKVSVVTNSLRLPDCGTDVLLMFFVHLVDLVETENRIATHRDR
jgi:hypothetical protein